MNQRSSCLFLLAFFAGLSSNSVAQDMYVHVLAGFTNYQGDIQSKRITLNQAGAAFGAQLTYHFSPRIAARAGFMYGKIKGSDAKSGVAQQVKRNLSFESNILEGQLGLELHLLDMETRRFSPYVFGGAAVYKHNPFTYTQTGRKVFLQPLSTEGQGLQAYPNRKPYTLTQFSLPFGAGFRMAVNEQMQLGIELGLRKTFTDYLDDVSDKYADQLRLQNERGALSVELAYRGDELPGGLPYPTENDLRGNPKSKDWYYFAGATLGIRLKRGGENSHSGTGSKKYRMGCPRNVY
ncbi:MAG: outer membrane beta-barrel protein [Dinghuibacter sp.]|nr:outer membrane beta-barrel protein [Dinghuibacter sp.]